MNNKSTMYELKPIFKLPEKIELPTCMYLMKKIVNHAITEEKNDCYNDIINNIRDKNPLPELRLLEERWDKILQNLSCLTNELNGIKMKISSFSINDSCGKDVMLDKKEFENLKSFDGAVINANPAYPPYSLLLLKHICKDFIEISSHTHSSVNALPEELLRYYQSEQSHQCLKIFLIWKEGILDSELVINPLKQPQIKGEVNILRHLGRLGLKILNYTLDDAFQATQIDSVLDMSHRLLHSEAGKERASLYRSLNAKLGRNQYYGGENLNICDISVWSIMKQLHTNLSQDVTPNMAKWFERMEGMLKTCN